MFHMITIRSFLDEMFRGIQSPGLLSRLLSEPSLIFSTALVIVPAFESAATDSGELKLQGQLRRSERIWIRTGSLDVAATAAVPGGARRGALVRSVMAD